MRRIIFALATVALFLGGVGIGTNFGQDKTEAKEACAPEANGCEAEEESTEMSEQQKKMLEEHFKSQAAGEEHKVFEKFVGKFKMTMKMWMMGAEKPIIRRGEMEITRVMNGNWVTMGWESDVPAQHTGKMFIGFDRTSGKYQSLSLSSLSTSMKIVEGEINDKKDLLTFKSNYEMEFGGMKTKVEQRDTWEINDDKLVMTMYSRYPGNPMMGEDEKKEMEITYVRIKEEKKTDG
ncbi:DUF1579 family protein [Planctomycetota bacterium]|nr:DUF1579 family protein [Planctomycetota bacterium]